MSGMQAVPTAWNSTPYYFPPTPPEPRWPNQMCELLAEAGRLLLEENNKFKARIAELEMEVAQYEARDQAFKAAGAGGSGGGL